MDQGSIATFKANYLKNTFAQVIAATDADPELSLRDFWKNYNLLHAIKNIATAWDNVTKKCMNGVWKNCVKRYVNTFTGFENERDLSEILERIIKLAKDLTLECEIEEIKELLDEESEELTNEELIALEEEKVAEERRKESEEKEKEEEVPQRKFTTKGLSEGLSLLNKTLEQFEKMDPNLERFARIERMAYDVFRPYREIYEEKKKRTIQATLSMFMKKTSPATPAPATPTLDDQQPSTSSHVAKEPAIAASHFRTIEDDSDPDDSQPSTSNE